MSQMWTMELTESTNMCFVIDMVARTLKWISNKPSWETVVSCKCQCGECLHSKNKRPITWQF